MGIVTSKTKEEFEHDFCQLLVTVNMTVYMWEMLESILLWQHGGVIRSL